MVSVDDADTNRKFATEHEADFPILSDPARGVANAYGVLGNATPTARARRWTFYLGPIAESCSSTRQSAPSTPARIWPPSSGNWGSRKSKAAPITTWTTRQLLQLAEGLSDDELDREFDIAHRTVRATFVHIIHNVEVWSDLMAGQPVTKCQTASPHDPSVATLLARLDRASLNLARVARAVAQRGGWDERWIDPLDGVEKTYGGAIAHVITHSMHHRAQLLYMLRRLEVSGLPEGDVLSWEQQTQVKR